MKSQLTLRDVSPESGTLASYVDSLPEEDKGNLDPSNPKHALLLNTVTNAILSGQLNEAQVGKLMRRNEKAAPVFAAAFDQSKRSQDSIRRDVLSKYFNPGQDATPAPSGYENFDPGQAAVPAKSDVQGAITDFLSRGETGLAKEIGFNNPNMNRSDYYQFLPTATGYAVGDTRKGTITYPDNRVMPAQYDPSLQGTIAGARKGAEITSGSQAQANVDLPGAETDAINTIKLVDDLIKHPGLSSAVGPAGILPKIPGTEQADFITRLEQLQGKQFLEAYNTLKGGGQITEIEGKKATDAMARMNRAQSKQAFVQGARDFQDAVRTGIAKLRRKAGQPANNNSTAPTQPKKLRYNTATGKFE